MPFTTDERKKISEMLWEKGVPEKCPLCGRGKFRLPDSIAFIHVFEPGKTIETLGGQVEFGWFPAGSMPCLILICNNCGNTILLNLKVTGLWEELGLEKALERETVK
ncbi:hypothetical protein B0813_000019 [Candidatus Fervidibacteria bacterium JGI MDM2 SSWTFF-3-K9]